MSKKLLVRDAAAAAASGVCTRSLVKSVVIVDDIKFRPFSSIYAVDGSNEA